MAADCRSVNDDSTLPDASNLESGGSDRAQPGITIEEFIARAGDLKLHDGEFADNLEAVQAEQGLYEIPEWSD